jgi:hypothetical protein
MTSLDAEPIMSLDKFMEQTFWTIDRHALAVPKGGNVDDC